MHLRSRVRKQQGLWLLVIIFLAPVFLPSAQASIDKKKLTETIDRKVQARATQIGVPGWALGIIEDGEVVLKRTVGVRSDKSDAKVDAATLFQVGSLAKTMSAMLAVKFSLQQKLRLDDPIKKYLTERCAGGRCEGITIKHLLNHTSGIVAGTANASIEKGESYTRTLTDALNAAKECAPGSCFRYNNAIYELLREILEKMDSHPYAEILSRELLNPLGLATTGVSFSAFKQSDNYALPHLFQKGHFAEVDPSTVYNAYPAAAGLNSNLDDLLKYVSVQLGNAPKVVSPDALKILHEATVEAPDVYSWLDSKRSRKDVKSSYALGHRVLQYPNLKVIFHTGWVKGTKTVMAIFPERKMGVVVLQNTDTEFGFQALEDVILLLRSGA